MTEFQVRKDDLTQSRLVETASSSPDISLAESDILVKIDRFAFTANNITYGVAGDRMGYWQFFPPTGENAEDWGMLPVWGFADVVAGNVEEVPVGDRLFGYFPPATYLKMTPTKIATGQFVDGVAHRSMLPPAYNNYRRVTAEPGYDTAMDNERMLLYPLHITSFCLWDLLKDNNWYDARQLVIISASSKTSIGLAYGVNEDESAPHVIGLTSKRNLDFVKGLGIYDSAVTYDALDDIDASVPTVIVDMSGNSKVLGRLHSRLSDNMKYCINVGLTHWNEFGKNDDIITERSKFFFAPDHIGRRLQDWGPAGFAQKSSAYMQRTAIRSQDWLNVTGIDGLAGLSDVFDDVSAGRIAPDQGLIVEL